MLTDVEGLYADWPASTEVVSQIDADELARAAARRCPAAWCPKMEACLRAVEGGVPRAHVLDGRVPHALLLEIFTSEGIGTMVVPGEGDRHERRRPSDRWDAVMMPQLRHAADRARPRRRRAGLGRRRHASTSTSSAASRCPRSATPTRRSSPRSPSRSAGWRTRPTWPCTSRASRLAERLVELLGAAGPGVLRQQRRRGQRVRAQAGPAARPRPTAGPRSSPATAASTAAPSARCRSPATPAKREPFAPLPGPVTLRRLRRRRRAAGRGRRRRPRRSSSSRRSARAASCRRRPATSPPRARSATTPARC